MTAAAKYHVELLIPNEKDGEVSPVANGFVRLIDLSQPLVFPSRHRALRSPVGLLLKVPDDGVCVTE
jgi:hypothetical protein